MTTTNRVYRTEAVNAPTTRVQRYERSAIDPAKITHVDHVGRVVSVGGKSPPAVATSFRLNDGETLLADGRIIRKDGTARTDAPTARERADAWLKAGRVLVGPPRRRDADDPLDGSAHAAASAAVETALAKLAVLKGVGDDKGIADAIDKLQAALVSLAGADATRRGNAAVASDEPGSPEMLPAQDSITARRASDPAAAMALRREFQHARAIGRTPFRADANATPEERMAQARERRRADALAKARR